MKEIIFDLMHDNHVEDTCKINPDYPTVDIQKLAVNRGRRCSCDSILQTACRPKEAECVCLRGGDDDNVFCLLWNAMPCQALQLMQIAAVTQKCLSGQ